MGDVTEIRPDTEVIYLQNYDQLQLLQVLRNILDASWQYINICIQDSLIKEFPVFKKLREPNIENLKLLADGLDSHHKNCNIATIVGASAGILGGAAAATGLVMLTVLTGGAGAVLAAPIIATAGGVTATAGGLTSFGAYVTNGIIEKVELGKINKLLEEDKACFERLFPFIHSTSEVMAAVEELMNFSVFKNMMEYFNNNLDVANAIRNEEPMQELPQGMKDFIDDLPVSVNQKQQMKNMLLDIMRSVEGVQLFRRIFDYFSRMAHFITTAYNIYNAAARVFRVADASFNAGSPAANLAKATKPATRIAAAFGAALSVIAIAIDVAVLVSASNDMAKGSKSELAGKVRNCAELLQKELNTLEEIYVAMTKRNDSKK